ncbi:MAG TPA: hypothetical protein VJZ26_15150 [Blastocatellia bacterium]|nr:hypothetical protein [Blastocatellia bacterium]
MIKAAFIAFALMMVVACGDAPRPTSADNQPFSIASEYRDAATGTMTIIITVPISATPPQVKAAAESVIASRKEQYHRITVKSFLEGSSLDGPPFAVSKLENDSVEHVFGTTPGGSVKIPTH